MAYIVFWAIRKTHIKYGTVANIARVYLSRRKIVHVEDDAYLNVNCDATMFKGDVGWITRDTIVILLRLKNLNILCVKGLKTK